VVETSIRARRNAETRARIAEAALQLFLTQGYDETTIDQIAEAAGVGRRTVFRHYGSKEAMLFDHLSVRRDVALRQLQARPQSEPALVSLHAVLREMCDQGFDRKLLDQIRRVLTVDPRFATEQLSLGVKAFEHSLIATLEPRNPNRHSTLELQALIEMAEGWFLTAVRVYFKQGERSLVEYFDEVVGACVQSSADDLASVVTGATR
jgi:AcrR family transcriptional regulator